MGEQAWSFARVCGAVTSLGLKQKVDRRFFSGLKQWLWKLQVLVLLFEVFSS